MTMKKWLADNRGFLVFLLCFGVLRTAIADWNPIPSGSMRPTLLEGDVVLVNRLAYDVKLPLTDIALAHVADPRRGDVVTFSSPKDGTRLIKRIVALPGDSVEMRNGVLLLNDEPARYVETATVRESVGAGFELPAVRSTEALQGGRGHAVQYLSGVTAKRTFARTVVPAGHYFMLGDNRDNSEDSRFIGFVPRELLIGRAHRVLVSADVLGHWMPRFERTVSVIR
jgi:signal peptidase I